MTKSPNTQRQRWKLLPYLMPLLALIALAAIAYTSGQRLLAVAEAQAEEDAAMLHWWHENQRATMNSQTTALAQRVGTDVDFAQAVAAVGLANAGYVAWLAPDQRVNAAYAEEKAVGDPLSRKLFAYVPAVGYAAADLWNDGWDAYFVSMAPVPEERGGGVILLQKAVDEATINELATLVGRDVILYAFAGKTPLISSDPDYITDYLWLEPSWMNTVATGQLPAAIQSRNYASDIVVGITAFPDFAGLTYSGYWAAAERSPTILQRIPWLLYALLIGGAVVVLLVGAWHLQRTMALFLASFREMDYQSRRGLKARMAGVVVLALLPTLLVAWFLTARTATISKHFDLRTSQIAKTIVIDATKHLTSDAQRFLATDLSSFAAEDAATLAETIRKAGALDATIIGDSDVTVAAVPGRELTAEAVTAAQQVAPNTLSVVTAGKTTLLAIGQRLADDTPVVGVFHLSDRLKDNSEAAPVDLSLLTGTTPRYTSLNDNEIATVSFDAAQEAALARDGEISYTQRVHWYPSKLTAYTLQLGEQATDTAPWRLVISQPSVAWSNVIMLLQGVSVGAMLLVILLCAIILLTVLNLDKPMLLRRLYTGFGFLSPAIIWLIWWQLGPSLFTLYLSFHKWSVINPAKPFVGFHNFRLIWEDDKFWNAMGNTLYYSLQIPIGMVFALALALALNRQIRGIRFLRTIYYMPAVTSIVVVSLMWQLLYNKELGIFNYVLSFVGMGPYGWLQSTTMAMPSIMGMEVWLGLGARMLLFLAGLQSISNDYYEAAAVDGANGWHKLWNITLPLLAPTTFFVFVTAVIGSFQVFGPIYVLTQGGPAGATDVAVHRIYFEAWQNLRFGYASAETVILFACLFILTAIQFRYFGKRVSYG